MAVGIVIGIVALGILLFSVMMPCKFSIWEGDDGKVYLTKMNMGLMGKIFGGNIAEIMGGKVARDEEAILKGLLKK